MRFVFDTNIIISAALFERSEPHRALRQALSLGEILLSLATLQELYEVLNRPKFHRYVTVIEREEFLAALVKRASLIEVIETIEACRDSKDNKILEVAVNGQASSAVSGDNDLRVLHPFRGIPMLTVADFLVSYGTEEEASIT